MFLGLAGSFPARSDERYVFHRVLCDHTLPTFELSLIDYWNIGDRIWPLSENRDEATRWDEHVAAMKRLERENGLYVLHDGTGYYDREPLEWRCGPFIARIDVDRTARSTDVDPSSDRFHYRANPRLTLELYGKYAKSTPLIYKFDIDPFNPGYGQPLHRIRAYFSEDTDVHLELCTSTLCFDMPEIHHEVEVLLKLKQLSKP